MGEAEKFSKKIIRKTLYEIKWGEQFDSPEEIPVELIHVVSNMIENGKWFARRRILDHILLPLLKGIKPKVCSKDCIRGPIDPCDNCEFNFKIEAAKKEVYGG